MFFAVNKIIYFQIIFYDDDDYVGDDQDSDGGKREEFNYQGLLKSLPLEFVQYL